MDGWTTFWGWLLITVLVIYSCLTIAITIGGFYDVMGMFAAMNEQHERDELINSNPKNPS